MRNICFLLNSFLHCTAYKNIIFCWVMHEQSIIDEIINSLDTGDARVIKISLMTDETNLRKRLSADIARGIRSNDVIDRSVARWTEVKIRSSIILSPQQTRNFLLPIPLSLVFVAMPIGGGRKGNGCHLRYRYIRKGRSQGQICYDRSL